MGEKKDFYRSLGLKIVALIAIIWGYWGIKNKVFDTCFFRSPQARFARVWSADVESLKKHRSLPVGFENISRVEVTSTSEALKDILKNPAAPRFQTKNGEGAYTLQIFLDQTEAGGVMVQYDLIDHKGNTVWELGRTFNQNLFSK